MSKVYFSKIKEQLDRYMGEADVFLKEGKHDYGLAILFRALSLAEILREPDSLQQVYLKIIQIYHALGQSLAVVEWSTRALRVTDQPTTQCRFHNYLMHNLLLVGQLQEVQERLQELEAKTDPHHRWVYFTYSAMLHLYLYKYLGQHGLRQVESFLKKAEEISSELELFLGEFYFYRGIFFLEEGLYYYATEELQKVLELETDYDLQIMVLTELGRAYLFLYEYDQSLEYLDRAKGLAAQHGFRIGLDYNLYYRGLYYQQNLEKAKAKKHLIGALHGFYRVKRHSEMARIYYQLFLLEEREQPIKAKMYLEEYRSQLNHLQWNGEVPVLEEVYELVGAEVS